MHRARGLRQPPRTLLALGLALGALLFASCDADEANTVTYLRGAGPHANLPTVAVYVAQAQGFFEDEGLTVTVVAPTEGADRLSAVENGDVAFASASASDVIARQAEHAAGDEESGVVAIAVFGGQGDIGYVVIRGSGIDGPEDFAGRVIGANADSLPALRAMLARADVEESEVDIQPVEPGDLNRFLIGELDAYPVQLSSDPYALRRGGRDVAAIDPADFEVPGLGLTVVTRRSLLEDDPALAESFIRATLRGAIFASQHIDDAIDVTLPHTEGVDPDHQSYVLETQLAAAAGSGVVQASHEQWQALIDLLAEYGALAAPIEVADVFDGSLVEGIYGRGELD